MEGDSSRCVHHRRPPPCPRNPPNQQPWLVRRSWEGKGGIRAVCVCRCHGRGTRDTEQRHVAGAGKASSWLGLKKGAGVTAARSWRGGTHGILRKAGRGHRPWDGEFGPKGSCRHTTGDVPWVPAEMARPGSWPGGVGSWQLPARNKAGDSTLKKRVRLFHLHHLFHEDI